MFSLTIETFNSSTAVFTYPTFEAVLEHMAVDLTPWFQPDDWRAELGAMLVILVGVVVITLAKAGKKRRI